MRKTITEVHLYQGVKFGGSVIKFVLLDEAFTDGTLRRGNKAEVSDGIGVRIFNEKSGEDIIVPFNNVAYMKLAAEQVEPVKASKAK